MKDYTLTEAKEILQKYFRLLGDSDLNKSYICNGVTCEDCLFNETKNACSTDFLDLEMIAKAEQYVKDHEQKVDWSKVPYGTPVIVLDDKTDTKHSVSFLYYANGNKWATCPGAEMHGRVWDKMELDESKF